MSKHRASGDKWDALQYANSIVLKHFYGNVDYLSKKRYGSRNKALIALRGFGYSGSAVTVTQFKKGVYRSSSLSALNKWCLLFGVSLGEMLSRDFGSGE